MQWRTTYSLMSQKNLIVGALLLLITAGSWWLLQHQGDSRKKAEIVGHTPDYYVEGLTGITMDSEGRPSQRLTAERMTHYPDDDSTELILPRMTLYDEQGRPPWRARSEKGWVSGDGEVILLQGEVHIDRSMSKDVRPIHITTRDLRIQPTDNYVESDAQTHMVSHQDTIDSKGIQVWFSKPVRIKLLANVRGRYEVNR